MVKKLIFVAVVTYFNIAFAQNIPRLPEPIQPGSRDTAYFICEVTNVNEDIMQSSRRNNFWTLAATGGKFQAVSPTVIRVMSDSVENAISDLFSFYKKNAAAAFIRSPWYDRGTRLNAKSLVKRCEADPSRATTLDLKSVPLSEYKLLTSDLDHNLNFIRLSKTALTDEQVTGLTREKPLSQDAFTRREEIQKSATIARSASAKAAGPYIALEGGLLLGDYSFEKGTFDLSRLKQSAEKYTYSSKRSSMVAPPPRYELKVSAKMLEYKPTSIEEAKKIERARAEHPRMKLLTYVQISDAKIERNVNPVINGTIAAIEVRDEKNELMFTMRVQ